MENIVANVDDTVFYIDYALEMQDVSIPLPFMGMDKSGAAVCMLHRRGMCNRGELCQYRHLNENRSVVCKHWLRGLCKKGDKCEFLHEYDMSKMPECYFYSKYKACHSKDCPFLHIDPESKIKDCPWYDKGFCKHGPICKKRHRERVACQYYIAGFCPDGPKCKYVHLRYEFFRNIDETDMCNYCKESGHRIQSCFKLASEQKDRYQAAASKISVSGVDTTEYQDDPTNYVENCVCLRCGKFGHTAYRCTAVTASSISVM